MSTMSIPAMLVTARATRRPDGTHLTAAEMTTLRNIALHDDEQHGYAWPSTAALCDLGGISINTLRKALRNLESYGYITRQVTPGHLNHYTLHLDVIEKFKAPAKEEPRDHHAAHAATKAQAPAKTEAVEAAPAEVEIVSSPVEAVEAPQSHEDTREAMITRETLETAAEALPEPVQGELIPAPAPKKPRKPRKRAAEIPGIEEDFIEFYTTYPLKKDRGTARGTYEKIRRRGVPAEEILEGARRYAEATAAKIALDPGQKRYIKHPSTWLNAEAWLNTYEDEAPVRALTPTQRKVRRLAQSLQAMQDAQGLPQSTGMYQAPALASSLQTPVQEPRELTYSPAGQAAPMAVQDTVPAGSTWSPERWTRTKTGILQLM